MTGTDTEVGKTFFTASLIHALQNAQHSVRAFKPIAAGCELENGQFKNEDALALMQAMTLPTVYEQVNPIALQRPIAPHIAAKMEGMALSVEQLQQLVPLASIDESFILVEGAGGWLVPLNEQQTFADYVAAENLAVVLVVGLKLGCINHALLTQESIKAAGLELVGWVANHIDPEMLNQQQNIETLNSLLDCPMLAELPFFTEDNSVELASRCVRIEHLVDS
ncbi:dethiobiotin synthase [Aliikangiella coralliicola]|uniref:ATP-dependent dethiobiotin synthetase BioD n=1 Tax=Aliikangiella coralliicola TaxID=2592383 RepID=A0A545UK93_9GAMM|nr:dethiobiotin synthase [Aliikangiella coralliicola]